MAFGIVYTLEHELELKRISLFNFALLMQCLSQIVNRKVDHVYDWPVACQSYYEEICASPSASEVAEACRNFLTATTEIREECRKHFEKCLRAAYG